LFEVEPEEKQVTQKMVLGVTVAYLAAVSEISL
jgi:hypothetical protein